MTTSTIRQKLHSYIDTADVKKIKAIYTMIEDSLVVESKLDSEFQDELDARYNEYIETGKSVTEKEANKRISHILKKGKIA